MKNIVKYGFFGVGLLMTGMFTSCSSYKHTHRLSQIPEKSVVIADKVGVELKVDENKVVQATSTKRHASPQDAKDEAYYNAIVNNNIHVLVDPIYKIQTSARILFIGGKSTATVTGFAGYYQNPRSYKEIKDELEAEDTKAKQDAFDVAVKQMKQLKDDGIIKQNTTVSSSDSKTTNIDAVGKLQELSLNNLSVEAEYEVTKTTETSSLVDEYDAFLKGVKNPSSVGLADGGSENAFAADEPAAEKKGLLSKLMFWKKK
jgi:uncharacterized protein YjgD (DUF1641 family)